MAIKINGNTVITDTYTVQSLGNKTTYLANTAGKVLTSDGVWSAQGEVTLVDAAVIALDMSTGINFTVTLGGNRFLDNPTNTKIGQRGRIRVKQDGTGGRTLGYGTAWLFPGGEAHVLEGSAPGEFDLLYYDVLDTKIVLSALGNVSSP